MSNPNPSASEFYTVRVWQETLGAEMVEHRFQVTSVLSGETRIFREANALLAYLTATAANRENERQP